MTQNSEKLQNTGLRSLLLVVLVLSAAANAVTSGLGAPLFVSITLGVVALAAATSLIVQHFRRVR
jgi:hypothetical protein